MAATPSRTIVVIALLLAAGQLRLAGGQEPAASAVDDTVTRIGDYIKQYYSRAQSIVAQEVVTMQPVSRDFGPIGFARHVTYETRVDWNPDATGDDQTVTVVRELIKASGPPLGSLDDPDCFDPKGVSPEPLAFLLPDRRETLRWKSAGSTTFDGRAAVVVEYRPVRRDPPQVTWNKDCGNIDMPGHLVRRVWADAATLQVMRVDEHLIGPVDIPVPRHKPPRAGDARYFTVERSDTSIRYRSVSFTDPDETLLLPSEIQSLSVILNSGVPRLRTTQVFSKYRRYVTGSRLVVE